MTTPTSVTKNSGIITAVDTLYGVAVHLRCMVEGEIRRYAINPDGLKDLIDKGHCFGIDRESDLGQYPLEGFAGGLICLFEIYSEYPFFMTMKDLHALLLGEKKIVPLSGREELPYTDEIENAIRFSFSRSAALIPTKHKVAAV